MAAHECPVPDNILSAHGFGEGSLHFRQISGHRLILAEMDAANGLDTPLPPDIPFEADDGRVLTHEAHRVMYVAPCERSHDLDYVFTYSTASKEDGVIYIHRVSRTAIETVWDISTQSQRSAANRMLIGIAPKFAERLGDMTRLSKELKANCERCGVWTDFTVETVTDDHPLCFTCAQKPPADSSARTDTPSEAGCK